MNRTNGGQGRNFVLFMLAAMSFQACADPNADSNPPGSAFAAGAWVPVLGYTERVVVLPLFFIPADVQKSDDDLEASNARLHEYLDLAGNTFQTLLSGDSFAVADGELHILRSVHSNAHFAELSPEDRPDSAHRILPEIFAWRNENRYDSGSVYLVIYVRPDNSPYNGSRNLFGGGRTFNGPPNTGGGYVEMEYTALAGDAPYPFLSTLVHELGHAFGLTHVEVFGYSMETNTSIMSYNPLHHSSGFHYGSQPYTLNPEEYLILSWNRRVFPDLIPDASLWNNLDPMEVSKAFLGPMDVTIGEFRLMAGCGYELFYNGQRVNGNESALYSYRQALENLRYNLAAHAQIKVEGRYNGKPIAP